MSRCARRRHQQGFRTWQNLPFTRKKVEWIRVVYHLKSRFGRLREQGLLTAQEMSAALGIAETTVHEWARNGLLRRIICDNRNHSDAPNCDYETKRLLMRADLPSSDREHAARSTGTR